MCLDLPSDSKSLDDAKAFSAKPLLDNIVAASRDSINFCIVQCYCVGA
jgi:hypothetical protein